MKLRITQLLKFNILFLVVLSLSLLKPFGILTSGYPWRVVVATISIVSFLICILANRKFSTARKHVCFMILIVLCCLCVGLINGKASAYDTLFSWCPYLFSLLALPILYVLERKTISLERLLTFIVWMTFISYVVRIGISLVEHYTGQLYFKSIYLESAVENWYRNGYLRINPPCFAIIIVPICLYLFFFEDKKKEKIFFVFIVVLAIYYSIFVHASRGMIIYQLAEVIAMFLFKKKRGIKQLLLYLALIISIIIFANSSYFNIFLDFFSKSSTTYGGSNLVRESSYAYALEMFFKNPILGNGIIESNSLVYNLSDTGFLYTITRFGLCSIYFYLVLLINGISAGVAARKNKNNNEAALVYGLIFSVFITGISIDCFYTIFAFSVPFVMAIIVYIGSCSTEKEWYN